MKLYEKLFVILLMVVFSVFFLLLEYPSFSDFDYWTIRATSLVGRSGHIDPGAPNAGFYVIAVGLSQICGIPYESLWVLPVLFVPLVLSLIVILRRVCPNGRVYIPIIAIFVGWSCSPTQYELGVHNVGLVLALYAVFLAILRMDLRVRVSQVVTFVIIIIMLLATNFISYKFTLLTVVFVILLEVARRTSRWNRSNFPYPGFAWIAVCGIVIVLAFNRFFYAEFISAMQLGDKYSYSTGIEKLFSVFVTGRFDSMSAYYWHTPQGMVYGTLARLLIVYCGLIMAASLLSKKMLRRETITAAELSLFCLGLSAVVLLLIYTILGNSDIGYLTLTGLLGFAVLYRMGSGKIRKFVQLSLTLLLVLSAYGIYVTAEHGSFPEQRDVNQFEYFGPVVEWISTTNSQNRPTLYTTDVFSYGVLWKAFSDSSESNPANLALFSRGDLAFLFKDDVASLSPAQEHRYVINYQERHFSTYGWEVYRSWSDYRGSIENSEYVNLIYNSEYVDIIEARLP